TAYAAGVRFAFPGGSSNPVKPFVDVVLGATHVSTTSANGRVPIDTSETHFMVQPSLGAAIVLARPWTLMLQAKFPLITGTGETFGDEYRIFAGIRLDF